mmetsp:Transcript_1491/g.2969  ORF Transcript_1491/g.2969 Transcript_1491/m.2969 type:complete len:308 (+) Transcript_1491:49-972(+)
MHSLLSLVRMLFILMTIVGKTVSVRPVRTVAEETVVVGCCEWNHFAKNGCDVDAIEDDCRQHIARGEEVTFWKGSSMKCAESPTTGRNVCARNPAGETLGWSCSSLLQKNLHEKRGQWSRMAKDEVALRKMSVYVDHRCWGGIYNVLDEFKDLVDAKIPLKGNDMMDLSTLEVAAAWAMEDVMAKLVDDYGASTEIPLNSQGMPAAVEFGKKRFYAGRSYDGVLQFLGLASEEDRRAALQMREAKQKEKEEAEARRQAEQRAEALRRQAAADLKHKQEEEECDACCAEDNDDHPYACEYVCGMYGCQ